MIAAKVSVLAVTEPHGLDNTNSASRVPVAAVSGVAACLAVIVGVSLSMPSIVERIEPGTFSGFETAATMLGGSAALGYIVIGLLAFVLGVCVTILCFRIRLLNREEQPDEQKEDGADGACQ